MSFATDSMHEPMCNTAPQQPSTTALYGDNFTVRAVAPWHNTPAQSSLGIPLNQLCAAMTPQTEHISARPLQVRVKMARSAEDEILTVAQMSKNLASQQRVCSDAPRAPRARSRTRAAEGDAPAPPTPQPTPPPGAPADSLKVLQQQMAIMQRTIDMHTAALENHRDQIRTTNSSIEAHDAVLSSYGSQLDMLDPILLKRQQAGQACYGSQLDQPHAKARGKATDTDPYIKFKTLESKYSGW